MKKNLIRMLMIIAIILEGFLVYNIFANKVIIYSLQNKIEIGEKNNKKLKLHLEKVYKNKKKISAKINKTIENKKQLKKNIKDKKIVYLTFDDGPSKNTQKILDILKQNNINATFFVNGSNTKYSKAIYRRIVDEGNAIGNHTYSHDYKSIYSGKESFIKDFNKLQNLIRQNIGYEPKILRFPGGSNNTISENYGGKNIMRELIEYMDKENYIYYDWNVDSTDASVSLQDKYKIVNSVISEGKKLKKVIVLMHDSHSKSTTVEALQEIITKFKSMGYEFRILNSEEYRVIFK